MDIWVKPWVEAQQMDLIATGTTFREGKLTGEYATSNCYGPEKVIRIQAKYDLSQYEKIYAYGDTSADKPMLELADEAYFKPFQ